MKRFKVVLLSLLSLVLMFVSNQRVLLLSFGAANLFTLVSQTQAYVEDQEASVVQPMNNTAFGQMNSVAGAFQSVTSRSERSKGLQFRSPVLVPGFSYRATHDSTFGGFGGNELSGDLAFDADIYDGLIAGLLYQHSHREASNEIGVSEHLDSDGVSLYFAKRLFNILNLGLSYNHGEAEHRLTRAVKSNLDRSSDGYTLLAGISDKRGKWGWSTTTSFGYVNDDYDFRQTIQTGRFGWGGTLSYDISKKWTLGAAFSYYNYVLQDTFFGIAPRDDDYYDIGPRLSYYPTDQLGLKLGFDSQEGYESFSAYTLRLSCDIAF